MKSSVKKILAGIVVAVILVGVYYIGVMIGSNKLEFSLDNPTVININKSSTNDADFDIFWQAWDLVNNEYYDKDLNYKEMMYGAISGMLDSLDDAYTMFMSPEESKNFLEDLEGEFGGIGIEVVSRDGYLVVVAPLEGLPAEEAGIRSKDIIAKIDGVDVGEYSFSEAINKIRGEKGSNVTLTVLHEGENETIDVTVTRDIVEVDSVNWEQKDDVMYVRVSQFGEDTISLMDDVIAETKKNGLEKMIVDIRDNPGGYLDVGVDFTSLFIPEGTAVIEKDRDDNKTYIKTTRLPQLKDIELVVLVNGGSASASEIFAGAIQDTGSGTIVGETTFGKGSVQNLEILEDDSQVKLTVSKWFTPNERQIDKAGIEPDEKIELSREDIENDNDIQLKKALEILH